MLHVPCSQCDPVLTRSMQQCSISAYPFKVYNEVQTVMFLLTAVNCIPIAVALHRAQNMVLLCGDDCVQYV